MPRSSSLSPDNILRFLQVTRDSFSANEIAAALHVGKRDRKALFAMLVKLKKRGAVEELPGGRYRLGRRKGEAESGGKAARPAGQRGGAAMAASPAPAGSEEKRSGGEIRRTEESRALARDEVR